ncbi:MAG TPA: hypothetical protein VKZ63_09955 [Kofleriaceae bacterium]|nr:hypothetical protein [Kofleriaceae bacterium]
MTPPAARPPDLSAEGWRIDRLLDGSLAIAAVLAALALGYLLYAALFWRAGRAGEARPAPRGASWRQILVPVAVTTAVFAAVDVPLFARATRDLHGTFLAVGDAERAPGAVRIEISAQRWTWNIRYAGLDGRFATDDDVVTMNDLRVPLGRPVIVQLASSDVVHSLFLPGFRVKLDAVPGRVHSTWFRPAALGRSEIACTEHCGVHHHLMRGAVTVMRPDEFDRWVAAGSRDALRIAAEDRRARAEEPTRAPPDGVDPARDPAAARAWGWTWRHGAGR